MSFVARHQVIRIRSFRAFKQPVIAFIRGNGKGFRRLHQNSHTPDQVKSAVNHIRTNAAELGTAEHSFVFGQNRRSSVNLNFAHGG